MKYKLLMILLISFVYTQDGIYKLYEIPEFKSKSFSISGDDLFNLKKQGDESAFGLKVSGNYFGMNQTLKSTLNYSINPNISSIKQPNDSTAITDIIINSTFSGSKYFTQNYIEPHIFYDGEFDLMIQDSDTENPLELLLGFGLGRITSARTVAQAVMISDLLESNLNNNQLIAVANTIAKASSGYYINKYKNDADIYYYDDLAELLNAKSRMMKLQQILSHPVYSNIANRYIGWRIRVGYKNILMPNKNGDGKLVVSGAYARPIKRNKQIYLGAKFDLPLDIETTNTAALFGAFSIDHTYTWTTKLTSTIDIFMPEGSDLYSLLEFNLSSTKIVLNSLTSTGEIKFVKAGNNNDTYFETNVRFTYFVF